MRVVVTGGAGFIGGHIAHALVARGDDVVVVDDLSTGRRANVPDGARLEVLDVRDAARVHALVAKVRPDVVCHQAAQTSVAISERDPVRDADVNVLGTVVMLEACRALGVARFVLASTGGAIYGEVPEGVRADEATPTRPISPYACAKLAAERYVTAYTARHGVDGVVLRYANVYGARQDPHGEAGVVAIFAERLLAARPVTVFARAAIGDDGCVRDYVHVADVVRANLAAIDGRLACGTTLNVGTGVGTTTSALLTRLAAHLGREPERVHGPARAGDLGRSVLEPARFVAALGAPTGLDDGLAATAAWFAAPS